jgi:acetyl esterase
MLDLELEVIASTLPTYDLSDVTSCRKIDARATADLNTSDLDDYVECQDRMIASDDLSHQISVRVYSPRAAPAPTPALLFLHGGAFCLGDLDTAHQRCLTFAAEVNCTVVNVDYRLAPEHPFPAGFNDCWRVLRWLFTNEHDLLIDRTRIAVGGSSAGAALAAALALKARDRGCPHLVFQFLLFPVTDHRMRTASIAAGADTPVWDTAGTTWMWRYYLGEEHQKRTIPPYASPALGELHDLPPGYLLTAEHDPLRDEGLEYGLGMLRAGVSVEIHQMPGAYHAFEVVAPDSLIGRRAVEEQVRVLRAGMHVR